MNAPQMTDDQAALYDACIVHSSLTGTDPRDLLPNIATQMGASVRDRRIVADALRAAGQQPRELRTSLRNYLSWVAQPTLWTVAVVVAAVTAGALIVVVLP